MSKVGSTINLVLKAVAIGMAIPSIVLLVLDAADLETVVMLLSIGLFALAVASLNESDSSAVEVE
jgi:hypothetical protein